MTTFAAAIAAIEAKLTAEWPHGAVPLVFDNAQFTLPDTPAPFVRIEIIGEAERQIAYGGGRGANESRPEGRIEAHVFVPIETGAAAAATYAGAVGTILRGQRENGVSYMAASTGGRPVRSDEGNYWRLTTVVDFHFDLTG